MADILEDEGISIEDVTGDSSSNEEEGKSSNDEDCPTIVVEECADSDVSPESPVSPQQSAIEELKRLCDSSVIYDRQIAGTKISSALVQIADNEPDIYTIFSLICKLSNDEEGLVRAELVESIPTIATYCQLYRPNMKFLMRQQLVPITVKLLSDEQRQVREASQTVLKILFQNNLIDEVLAKEWICPFVASNAKSATNEERLAEGAALMCHLAPLVDSSLAKECFLEVFASLADQTFISIRAICAENFGEFCKAVGREATESVLLPQFLGLCADIHWSVRKLCTEAFADVASVLSPSLRWEALPKVYVTLLCDEARCVNYFAYQNLGKFIATFDTSNSLGYARSMGDKAIQNLGEASVKRTEMCVEGKIQESVGSGLLLDFAEVDKFPSSKDHPETVYNSFQFWRTPLLEIELDPKDCAFGKVQSCENSHALLDEESLSENCSVFAKGIETDFKFSRSNCFQTSAKKVSRRMLDREERVQALLENVLLDYKFEPDVSSSVKSLSHHDQVVVPPELLEKYVSMVDSTLAEVVDPEITWCCAFTLPAVAQTLGRANWGCLRDVFYMLSIDRQDKVRKTVAASLHGLALILGKDIASVELVPRCLSFFNDTDEIRTALLKNLSSFVGIVDKSAGRKLMEKISDFVNADNDRNWRLRHMLASQLCSILLERESHEDVMVPVAMFLLQDRVWEVRLQAMKLMSFLLSFLYQNCEKVEPILRNLFEDFADSSTWRHRQTYAILCELTSGVSSMYSPTAISWYSQHLISHLLPLAQDSVPNVRICVARCLFDLPAAYLEEIASQHGEYARSALVSLREDSDRDVCDLSAFKSIELNKYFGQET